MKKSKFFHSLPFKLLVGVALGIGFGLLLNLSNETAITTAALNIVVTLKYILGQLINFCVPLIIIGFIAPSITKLGSHASRMLGVGSLYCLCFLTRSCFILCTVRICADPASVHQLHC